MLWFSCLPKAGEAGGQCCDLLIELIKSKPVCNPQKTLSREEFSAGLFI